MVIEQSTSETGMTPELFTAWREAFGGRRFIITLGAGIVDTLLFMFFGLPPDIYRDLTIATVAAYIAGSTWQKVKDTTVAG